MNDPRDIPAKLSLREKIAYCTGADFWHTKALPRLAVPPFLLSDGPHGLRVQAGKGDMLGINQSFPATCFPTAVTAGASWDPALWEAEGEAIGLEAAGRGVGVLLGPGCNIKRSPLGGRNFEYISEDPLVAGKMAAAFIRGVQKTGTSACPKHFAANNQESDRQNGNSLLDERTLREIYLLPFELAVKEGHPDAVMSAYNKINGIHASDHRRLLTDILRDEWGFDGMVVTDWGGLHNRIDAFRAGCDLCMPGGSRFMAGAARRAVKAGELSEGDIDRSVGRILRLAKKHADKASCIIDPASHHNLARRIAEAGAVLLQNDRGLLPLCRKDAVLIGPMADRMRYQGTGSSHIRPTRLTSLHDAWPEVPFTPAGDTDGRVTAADLAKAKVAASHSKIAVVAIGLPEICEMESVDRKDLSLPAGYNRLVETVAEANPNTVVLLFGGSPMLLPWADRVGAILYLGLPGQAGGEAAANLLEGLVTPSGKLTESWPLASPDSASAETFGKKNTEYREGIFVGYRYYESASVPVRYSFGHGLSYTDFVYSSPVFHGNTLQVTIQNTGAFPGAEVAELYVAPPEKGIFRPVRELRGFQKVFLSPGESRIVEFPLSGRSFAVYQDGWRIPKGSYTLLVGSSLGDIRIRLPIQVDGEELVTPDPLQNSWYETPKGAPSRPDWELLMGSPVPVEEEARRGSYTLDSTPSEMRKDFALMRLFCHIMEKILAKKYQNQDPAALRMMLSSAVGCPLRALSINAGGFLGDRMLFTLLHLANHRFTRAFATLFFLLPPE